MSHWEQQYALALAGPDAAAPASSRTLECTTIAQFLAEALAAAETPETPLSLAVVGEELLVPLAQLGSTQLQKEQGLDRSAVLRALQLQVLCRLFCCCANSHVKAKTPTKKHRKQRLKTLKKETRTLLDRIALLLDAANPPSLTDADERSPFHEFLQDVLAKAFASRLPAFTKSLLSIYELEGDESRELPHVALTRPLLSLAPVATAPPEAPLAAQSILSALRDEQRPLKRSRTETAVPFKKMQLPTELRRRASVPSTRSKDIDTAAGSKIAHTTTRDPSSKRTSVGSHSKHHRSSSTTSGDNAAASSSSNASATLVRRSVSTTSASQHARVSAEKPPRLAHHRSLGAAPKATLLRLVDRSLVAGPQSRFAPSATNNTPHTLVPSPDSGPRLLTGLQRSQSGPKPPTAPLPRTAVSTLVRSASVVLRTPDRPQRRPPRTSRVLIESSPPFRNPNVSRTSGAPAAAAVRPRKTPSAIAPPQLG